MGYINKEVALHLLSNAALPQIIDEDSQEYISGINVAYGLISNIPTSCVHLLKFGSWERIDYQPSGHDYRCSLCGCKNDCASQYCPDCGAMMAKKKKE